MSGFNSPTVSIGDIGSLTSKINEIAATINEMVNGVLGDTTLKGTPESARQMVVKDFGDTLITLSSLGIDMQQISGTSGTPIAALNTGIVNMALNFQENLKPVAMAICVAFFIISMVELAMSERMTIEFWVKYWAKLVIGVAAIYYCKEISENIFKFGNALGDLVVGSGSDVGSIDGALANLSNWFTETVANDNTIGLKWLFAFIAYYAIMLAPKLICIVLKGVIYVVGFSRIIELAVRAAFMPIGMALLSDDGWKGAGGRYIKKYIAICAQCAVMSMIGTVASWLITNALAIGASNMANNGLGGLASQLALAMGAAIACIMALFKSIGITNDIFGA